MAIKYDISFALHDRQTASLVINENNLPFDSQLANKHFMFWVHGLEWKEYLSWLIDKSFATFVKYV